MADEYSTAIVIAIMIVLSSTLRFYQEWKSEGAVHGLLKLITKSISVIRIDSVEPIPREMIVASEELVPGDLVTQHNFQMYTKCMNISITRVKYKVTFFANCVDRAPSWGGGPGGWSGAVK